MYASIPVWACKYMYIGPQQLNSEHLRILTDLGGYTYTCDLDITFGFLKTSHSVLEEGGQLDIQVGVLNGSLQREVILSYTIADVAQHTSDGGECML